MLQQLIISQGSPLCFLHLQVLSFVRTMGLSFFFFCFSFIYVFIRTVSRLLLNINTGLLPMFHSLSQSQCTYHNNELPVFLNITNIFLSMNSFQNRYPLSTVHLLWTRYQVVDQPRPKMVTNSFRNSVFMHPMGGVQECPIFFLIKMDTYFNLRSLEWKYQAHFFFLGPEDSQYRYQ